MSFLAIWSTAAALGASVLAWHVLPPSDPRGAVPAPLLRRQLHSSSVAAPPFPTEEFRQGVEGRGRQGTPAQPRLGQAHPLPLAAPSRRPTGGDEPHTADAVCGSRLWTAARLSTIRRVLAAPTALSVLGTAMSPWACEQITASTA